LITETITPEAGQRCEHRGPDAWPHEDLAQRRRRPVVRLHAADQLGDPLRVGAHQQREDRRAQADGAGCKPGHGQRRRVELAA
jgi:hypothetical protein